MRAISLWALACACASTIAWGACSPFDASSTGPDAAVATSDGGPSNGDASTSTDARADGDAGAVASYRELVLEDRPVLYLRLGDATANSAANEVVAGSSAAYEAASSAVGAISADPNAAASFDGGSLVTIASLPDFSGQQHFTIELWVKPKALLVSPSEYAHLFSTIRTDGTGKRQGYSLFIGNTNYGFGVERFVDDLNDKAIVATPPSLTKFTHVVGTYDGTTLTLYIDGAAGPATTDARSMTSAAPPLAGFLGGVSSASRDFSGVLDEVAVYDHALTPARVTAHYVRGVSGP
jgi:hypothetical protein